jgi:hypothetical protein
VTLQLPGPQVMSLVQPESAQAMSQDAALPQLMLFWHESGPHFTVQGPGPQVMLPVQASPPVLAAQSTSQPRACAQLMSPVQEPWAHSISHLRPDGQVQPLEQSSLQIPLAQLLVQTGGQAPVSGEGVVSRLPSGAAGPSCWGPSLAGASESG